MEIRPLSIPYKQSCLSKTDMSKGRLQQVDIPLKQEVNNPEEDFSNSKEEDLGIQALEEEVVETLPEEAEDNKHSLLEEEEAVTITVTRGISNVIVAINLGTIALNAEKDDREEAAFLVQQELGEKQENIWYLDTRASNHMCGHRELFSDLDETIQGLVTFGDTSKVPFKGKGNIPIKLKNDDSSYIANVYYVPAIKQKDRKSVV